MSSEDQAKPLTGDSRAKYSDQEPIPFFSYRCKSELVEKRNQDAILKAGGVAVEPKQPLTYTHRCKSHRDRCLNVGKHLCICGKSWPLGSATEKEKI